MTDHNSTLWAQMKDPVSLPVIVDVPSASGAGSFHSGSASEPFVTVQMNALGGRVFLVPLSGNAIEKMKKVLVAAEQLLGIPPSGAPRGGH